MKYRCPECDKILIRDEKQLVRGRKAGIKEFCEKTGKYVKLVKVKKPRKLTEAQLDARDERIRALIPPGLLSKKRKL